MVKIKEKEGIPLDHHLRLFLEDAHDQLEGGRTLTEHGVSEASTLYLVVRPTSMRATSMRPTSMRPTSNANGHAVFVGTAETQSHGNEQVNGFG